jgi:hypothetical protein
MLRNLRKMRTKKFILILALLFVAIGSRAVNGVWVERIDGKKQCFLFADYPVITYTADHLVMTTTTATAEFPIAELRRYYFSGDGEAIATAIRNAEQPGGMAPLIRVTADGAQLSGFAPQTAVDIYDLGGRLLARRQTATDGTLTVSLSDQPKGIYIIKTNQTTLKIQNQ